MKKERSLWAASLHEERLHCETSDDAIDEEIAKYLPIDFSVKFAPPATITVYQFKPDAIPESDNEGLAIVALEIVIEWLDEEYGDPDEGHEHTSTMKKAAIEFINVVLGEYVVWAHKPTGVRRTVNTIEWIAFRDYDVPRKGEEKL